MKGNDLIRQLVLESICNDYENVDQVILPEIVDKASNFGLHIDRPEIVEALAGLVAAGLAKAYLLSTQKPFFTELEGMPPLDTIETDLKTYFYITDSGRNLILSE